MALCPGPSAPSAPGAAQLAGFGDDPHVRVEIATQVFAAAAVVTLLVLLVIKRRKNSGHTGEICSVDAMLEAALEMVDTDPECRELASRLVSYAESAVAACQKDLEEQLQQRAPLTLDLLWPGSGYNSVACGGNFAVLGLLEKRKLLTVGRILGASGGAASAMLCLADKDRGVRTLLRYYMAYAKWSEKTWDKQVMRETPLWTRIYLRLIQDEDAFRRLRDRGWVAVMTGMRCSNYVYHNFATREQCAQAYYASGNASVMGFLGLGARIPGIPRHHGHPCDGGSVCLFPNRQSAVLYYNTAYETSTMMSCSLESIKTLFQRGVDETIATLKSDTLRVQKGQDGCGGMRVRMPGPSGCVGADEFKVVKDEFGLSCPQTVFYDIGEKKEELQERWSLG